MANKLTPMSKDFNEWYTDIVKLAELADHSPVKGSMVIRPYGYKLWEEIKEYLDKRFKETGHENAYFPLLIPNSFIQKEADHIEGFSPELAMVTHGGGKELEEPLVIRPTSETIINYMYSKWINSYRDLPILINQWANVLRWEMRTRLFLRTSEFLWQEGHTAHATKKEANEEALQMLDIYHEYVEDIAAVSVVKGIKSENEKFAGAITTYSIETMMQDYKALQAGTSHELGQNFSKAFDIKFSDKNNQMQYPYQTSWGVSTRLIGMIIMAHGDDKGLKLPPRIAPIQVVIIPINQAQDKNSDINKLCDTLVEHELKDIRCHLDSREEVTPGFKFNDWEQKGVPIRIEIGPKDIEKGVVTIIRRDTSEKSTIQTNKISETVTQMLEDIQKNLLQQSKSFMQENSFHVENMDELVDSLQNKDGFYSCYWNENTKDELLVKEKTKATLRCYPLDANNTGKAVNDVKVEGKLAIFSKAY